MKRLEGKKDALPQQTPAVQQVEVRRHQRIFADFGKRRQRRTGIIFNVKA